MPACSRGGFIALAAFGDQAFDLPPFLSAVSIFLFDFTRQEKDALSRDLEDHGGALFQVEDIADGGGDGWNRTEFSPDTDLGSSVDFRQ